MNLADESIETHSNKDETEKNQEADAAPTSPFSLPKSDQTTVQKTVFFVCWPFSLILYLTIPNSKRSYWKKFYLLTFFMSLVWLSLFSYLMVWMITIIGKKLINSLFKKKEYLSN